MVSPIAGYVPAPLCLHLLRSPVAAQAALSVEYPVTEINTSVQLLGIASIVPETLCGIEVVPDGIVPDIVALGDQVGPEVNWYPESATTECTNEYGSPTLPVIVPLDGVNVNVANSVPTILFVNNKLTVPVTVTATTYAVTVIGIVVLEDIVPVSAPEVEGATENAYPDGTVTVGVDAPPKL
jgi:hypothetical protein